MTTRMLGLISNSDGRAETVSTAIDLFHAGGAEYVVHCGDVGGRHVLDALSAMPSGFIWGDRDADKMGLMRYGNTVGVECLGLISDFEMHGKRIVILHGDDRRVLRKLLDEQQHDYLICGHDLAAEDYTVGKTRVLNPGPLYGGQSASALLLDLENGTIKRVAL